MITAKTIYIADLRTEATHVRSGNSLFTDAPVDNEGKGEYFSPTDLVATALGSCILTIMGIAAKKHQFNIDNTRLEITKIMNDNPRKIGEVVIDFYFPNDNYSEKEIKILEHAVKTCPVALSLHPDIIQTIRFHFN